MNRTQRPSPLPRFLDVAADSDALDLIGLTPAECTRSRVEAALQRQLDRVASHAEADTPEADEVRLALHAAAAQLLDPATRRTVIEDHAARSFSHASELSADDAESSVPTGPTDAWQRPVPPQTPTVFPAEAVAPPIRYAAEPDPNAAVKKVLIIGGIAATLVIGGVLTLILLTPPSAGTKPAVTAGGGSSSAATATSGGPASTAATNPAASGEWRGGAGSDAAVASADSEAKAQSPKAAAAKIEFAEAGVVIRDLRLAAAKAKTDPSAAMNDFRKAVGILATWWPRYDVGARRAADDGVLEFLYVMSDKPEAAAAIAELGKRAALPPAEAGQLGADAVWPAAWSTGVLTRLSVERGLPRSLAAGVAQALNDSLGAGRGIGTLTFEGGAQSALRRMPVRLVAPRSPAQADAEPQAARTSAEGMKRWADAIAAVGAEAGENERMYVDGLEQILLNGTEPDTDQASYEAVEVLATRIKWRADGPARERLLEWFNDPRISAADLRVLTGVLAGKSGAENVDATMQLSVTASPDDRAKLRTQYATAWGLIKTEQRDKAFEQWRGIARGAYFSPPGTDELAEVARVVMAVQVNHAARKLWLGDAVASTRILSDLDRIPETIQSIGATAGRPSLMPGSVTPQPTPPMRAPGSGKFASQPVIIPPGGDGPWAEQYLRAERNIPVRLQRLSEAEALPAPLTKVDAAVLVEVACFGSPGQVRLAGQRVVGKYADDPSIVQAMLDQLPTAPKVQSVSETISKVAKVPLPKVGDPDWEIAARRALVDRLLGLLAGQGPQAGIDQASSMISEAYISMAGADSGPPDESSAERCQRGAGQLYKLWKMEAERLPPPDQAPGTLDQIDRRRRSRQQVASGPVQAFTGEEVSIAELLGYIVCAERPAQATRVLAVINDLARQRRECTHVFAQMIVTEKAIARLWLLRFGEVAQ